MAMTNDMIILMERCKLMKEGKISGTGEVVEMEINGKIEEMEIPEEIHTYQRWKTMGFQVRKGEKAISKFTIWKYSERKIQDGEEEKRAGKCFMKMSAFFAPSQVERIAAI